MIIWLPLLILSAQSAAPMEHRYAETVFAADFEREIDSNYDGWPDDWTRLRGPGFPPYIDIGIVDDPSHASQQSRCLRIDLDGSGGTALSPPIEISPLFSYLLEGKLKTEGLIHDVAYYTVTFLDSDRNQKEVFTSEKIRDATAWQEIRVGPLTPEHHDVTHAVIGLHLVPTSRSDLTGAAMFDDICFARLPHMTIESQQPFNIFTDPSEAAFTCTVSGTCHPDTTVMFELLDVVGNTIASEQLRMTGLDCQTVDTMAVDEERPTPESPGTRHVGAVTWHPPVPNYGFYHVRATLHGDSVVALEHCVSLAVMPNVEINHRGEFGWSLVDGGKSLSEEQLLNLLHQSGVSWIKYPIWYSPDDESAKGEQIAAFADQLGLRDIEMVGVFDQPPEQVRTHFSNKEHLTVAEVFLQPDLWSPLIDPLMIRLSLKIQWWQLGADEDDSFIDYTDLEERLRGIRTHLKQFGQRMRLGLAWNWLHSPPATQDPPWDFLALTESPPLTSVELARFATQPHSARAQQWITLWPLARDRYDVETRTRDLVLRMLAAKVNGIEAVFAGNPFDSARGLLHEDGTPGDLFLPWCITSRMVGGAEYLGSLRLPNGSHNHVFARDGQAVMVVWSDAPTTESLYLGDHVSQIDPWGRYTPLYAAGQRVGEQQSIHVGTLPVFVTGMNLAVARWRLDFAFEPNELASVFARQQTARFRFRNTFQQGVGGTITLHVPDVWDISSPHLRFKLANDEELDQDFNVVLHSNASSGPQCVRVDFDVVADKEYHFSVYRDVQVGYGDVAVDLTTWIDDEGRLIVEQHLINRTEQKLNFNCYLFAPDRRRTRMQVFDIGPGRVTHTFKLPDGQELIGKTLWLRVEQIDGDRLMNFHVRAEP